MSILENILIVIASIIAAYISLRFVWSFSKTLTTFIIFLSIMIPISSANIMKWWKTSLSIQGLLMVYMLIASFTNLSANISFINTILPVSICAICVPRSYGEKCRSKLDAFQFFIFPYELCP